MLDTNQTIVALSSAAGGAARGVVRLSGPAARAEADRVFRAADGRPLAETAGYRRVEGRLTLGAASPPASALVFRAPKSYTGEDLVELHLPGSPPVLGRLLETLQRSGAVRAAAPGEFTARAFLNGRLDLSQAEGVLSVIRSRSEAGLRAARQLLDGAVSRISRDIRRRLIALLAELEAGIDFVEEDIRFISGEQIRRDLADVAARLDDCLAHGREADVLETLPTVALIGRPNVGKSSLLNALTGRERSIVSERAGTTRDPVSGRIEVNGRPIILVDTAGLADAVGNDAADALAQSATAARRDAADLTLLVFDATTGFTAADAALTSGDGERTVRVANKIDLRTDGAAGADVAVSARTGAGLEALRVLIADRLGDSTAGGTLGLNARHCAALAACRSAVGRAAELAADDGRAELIALELRDAAHHVGLVAGEVAADDILDRIFSQFCVGK